jgi:hypothetical protein
MNKTESEFALILEAQKRAGKILRYEFEGITLRWQGIRYTPDFVIFSLRWQGIRYTPEFVIFDPSLTTEGWTWRQPIRLIEIKGAWTGGKFERAVERFRHARTYWPEFQFEMHQKTKQGWIQKY